MAERVRVMEDDTFQRLIVGCGVQSDFGEHPAVLGHKPRNFIAVAAIGSPTTTDVHGLVQGIFAWDLNWGTLQCVLHEQVKSNKN